MCDASWENSHQLPWQSIELIHLGKFESIKNSDSP